VAVRSNDAAHVIDVVRELPWMHLQTT